MPERHACIARLIVWRAGADELRSRTASSTSCSSAAGSGSQATLTEVAPFHLESEMRRDMSRAAWEAQVRAK